MGDDELGINELPPNVNVYQFLSLIGDRLPCTCMLRVCGRPIGTGLLEAEQKLGSPHTLATELEQSPGTLIPYRASLSPTRMLSTPKSS
ncbi:hypothetical protein C7B82_24775 [Stenomitos frigidus ULC18]|uniref:Uncharacterized protein n=1 Tax=Stenomitos frigidus ULC18 TaxID=2107698 RepID=A0A2T1DWX0_9CYAN|nr:hypothetical protein C7B82_24775 [Stenomitos frigidus ULC18]